MRRCFFIFLLFILLLPSLGAQDNAMLFRGRLPEVYLTQFNGTNYWSEKSFREGKVWYNGKVYEGVLVNIDAFRQEVLVKQDAQVKPLQISRDEVAWLQIGNTRYVNLNYLGYADAPAGFFELVHDGRNALFRQVVKLFLYSTYNRNGKPIGYYDPEYNEKAVAYFGIKEYYYALRNGKIVSIGRRAFRKGLGQAEEGSSILAGLQWHSITSPDGQLLPERIPSTREGLPPGWFLEQVDSRSVSDIASEAQTASYRNKVYIIGQDTDEPEITLSGVLTETETGKVIAGVLIYDENTVTYEHTDTQGRYSIRIPHGSNIIHYSSENKEEAILKIDVRGSGSLDVSLPEKITLLEGAVISAHSMEQHRRTAMGVEQISMRMVGKIPSAFGEGDVLKALHMLPGVQTAGEAAGGINVRGGSTGENLILLNGNTIFNPSHLFGLFSSFNPDIVDEVELYKGVVPAEFGGRISSVIDVHTREGDPQRIRGSLGLGVVTSRFHIEGPIVKNKTTFLLGARTTYSDWILKKLPSSSYYSGARAGFSDLNAGLTHRFNDKHSLQLSAYYATDRFDLVDVMGMRYRNINTALNYRYKGVNGESFLLSGGYDEYVNSNGDYSYPFMSYDLTTTIRQAFLKGVFRKQLGEKHLLTGGIHTVLYGMDPGRINPTNAQSSIVSARLDREWGLEPALFVSDAFTVSDVLSLDGGFRLSSFAYPSMAAPYWGPEVRLSAKYTPVKTFSVKGGFDMMHQYIHLISNTAGISPTDTWRLSGDAIRPMSGWQTALGVYWSLPGAGLDFSTEGYWKHTAHALDYKVGADLLMNPNIVDELVPVNGKAFGLEWMVKKPVGRLSGWMSYTWSRSFYQERMVDPRGTIAGGAWYKAPFDKPHEFKAMINWAITHRYSLSANIDYSTGRPMTSPIGRYIYGHTWHISYGQRNNARIPDYFRIDLALNIDPGHYLKAFYHTSVTVGVFNVLGRKNPYSVYFTHTPYSATVEGHMLSVFATQVPYINLNILF